MCFAELYHIRATHQNRSDNRHIIGHTLSSAIYTAYSYHNNKDINIELILTEISYKTIFWSVRQSVKYKSLTIKQQDFEMLYVNIDDHQNTGYTYKETITAT